MSTGTIIVIALSVIACMVAAGVVYATVLRASHTAQRNVLGQASDNERAQANRTAVASVVGLIVLFLVVLGMPLAVKLGHNLTPDPTEETTTPTAVSEE